MEILTSGWKVIDYDKISKIIEYYGGTDILINNFKRYLQEADSNKLEGFLKFTTG